MTHRSPLLQVPPFARAARGFIKREPELMDLPMDLLASIRSLLWSTCPSKQQHIPAAPSVSDLPSHCSTTSHSSLLWSTELIRNITSTL